MLETRRPLTLFTIPKEVRLIIWEYLFPEVEFSSRPWCSKCRSSHQEKSHCTDVLRPQCFPAPGHLHAFMINEQLWQEMVYIRRRAPVVFHAPTRLQSVLINAPTRLALFRSHKSVFDRIETICIVSNRLACLTPGFMRLGSAEMLPKLKKIVLKAQYCNEASFLDVRFYAQNTLVSLFRCIRSQNLPLKINGKDGKAPLHKDNLPCPIQFRTASRYTRVTAQMLAQMNDLEATLGVIRERGLEIRHTFNCDITVDEQFVEWPFFTEGNVHWDYETRFEARLSVVVIWDKNGQRFEGETLPDLSKEWWFAKWAAQSTEETGIVYGEETAEWPFGHMSGKFSMELFCGTGDLHG